MRKVKYKVDFSNREIIVKSAMQNDSLTLEIEVLDNGEQVSLADSNIELLWVKPDNFPKKISENITLQNNKIIVNDVDAECTSVSGICNFELTIKKSDKQISTFPLTLKVIQSVINNPSVENTVMKLLEDLIIASNNGENVLVAMDKWAEEHQDLENIADVLSSVKNSVKELSSQIAEKANKNDVANLSSVTPEFISSIDEMIDTTKTYVNITDGYIYLYNSTTSNFEKSSLQYQATGLSDKSVDITKLEEKIQNKFEKETTETDIIGGELSISKYMINGVDSTSKVVEGNSLAYTTNTTYGTYGWIFENIKGKKYQIISTVENVGNISADFNFMKAYKAEISGGVVSLNGDIVGEMVTLDSGVSVTKTYIITSDQDETIYKGIALCIKCNINGATLKLTQTVNEINTVTSISRLKMIADVANVANTLSPEYKKDYSTIFQQLEWGKSISYR